MTLKPAMAANLQICGLPLVALLPGIKNLKSDPEVKYKVRGKEMSAPVQPISTELETSLWGLGAQISTRKYRTCMRSGLLNKFPYSGQFCTI